MLKSEGHGILIQDLMLPVPAVSCRGTLRNDLRLPVAVQVTRAKCSIQRLVLQGLLEPVPITALEAPSAAPPDGTRLLSHVPSAGCPRPSSTQPQLDCKPAASHAVVSSMPLQPDAEPGASLPLMISMLPRSDAEPAASSARMSSRSPQPSAEPGASHHGAGSRHDRSWAGPASQHSSQGLAASPSCLSGSPDAQVHGCLAQGVPNWLEMPARGMQDAQLSGYSFSAEKGPCSPQTSSLTPTSNSDNSSTQDAPSIAGAGTPAAASRRDFRGPISPEWLATESPAVPAWAHQAGGHNRQDSQSAGDASSPARPAAQDGGHLISRSSRFIASGNA